MKNPEQIIIRSRQYGKLLEQLRKEMDALGYRLLAPGQLDPYTIERCAEVAQRYAGQNEQQANKATRRANRLRQFGDPFGYGKMAADASAELTAAKHEALAIAAAIRALKGDG